MTGDDEKRENNDLYNELNRVLVMGEGRILEDGNPKELLKKPMGFFTSLYRQEQKGLEF